MNKYLPIPVLCGLLFLRCGFAPLAGGSTDTELGSVVAGCVVLENGSPAGDARIRIRSADYVQATGMARNGAFDAVTDSTGRFSVSGISPGRYAIEANDLEYSAALVKTTVEGHGNSIDVGTLGLKPFARIFGVIQPASSAPYPLLRVQMRGLERLATVGQDGTFAIVDLPEGSFDMRLVSTDSTAVPVELFGIRVKSAATASVVIPAGWRYGRRLYLNTTASGADVAGNITNFPTLIRFTESNFDFSQTRADGNDLRFAKADGTALPYEIERWDAVTELAEVWVKIDTVYGNDSAQSLMMYWGASTAHSTSSGQGSTPASLSNGATVFDTGNGFQGVWHLSGPGNAIAFDATLNLYDGTPVGISSTATAAGIIGQARTFDGVSNALTMPNTAAGKLDFQENDTYSISLWVYADTIDTLWHAIAGKGHEQYYIQYKCSGNNKAKWEFVEYHDKRGWEVVDDSIAPGPKQWLYLVGVRSGAGQKLYINGVLASEVKWTMPGTYDRNTGDNFSFGRYERPDSIPKYQGWSYFKGKIDEARVVSVATTPDWIKLCYMNQKEQDALLKW